MSVEKLQTKNALMQARYSSDDVELVSKKEGFKGFFSLIVNRFRHRKFDGGWSAEIEREVFTKTEAAAAILYDPKNDLVALVEQFRAGCMASEYGPWCLETVAGMLEPGETPDQLIVREIQEEAGVVPDTLHKITSYYSTPGVCNEKIHLYCAECDLSSAGGVHGLESEHEDIMLHVFPAVDALDVMLQSRMNNAATLISMLWLERYRSTVLSAGS